MDLVKTALALQLKQFANQWNDLSLDTDYCRNRESYLACDCWQMISNAIDCGYLEQVTSSLIDAIEQTEFAVKQANERGGIRFSPVGYQFYLLAGYQTETEDEGGVTYDPDGTECIRIDRMLKPGLIDYIVDSVFPRFTDWEFGGDLSRDSADVRRKVFGQYCVVCELSAEMILHSTYESTPRKRTPSECEMFIYKSWKEMTESGKKVDYSAILALVQSKFPEDKRRRNVGHNIGELICSKDDIVRVVQCLKNREKRENQKRKS